MIDRLLVAGYNLIKPGSTGNSVRSPVLTDYIDCLFLASPFLTLYGFISLILFFAKKGVDTGYHIKKKFSTCRVGTELGSRVCLCCQKPEPEHCERRTKRKRNQQELDFERQDDNAHVYTSLESTMPVQFTEVRDKIGVDSDMDKIIDDDPSPIIEAGLTPLNSKCLILYVLIPFQETTVYLEDDENDLDKFGRRVR